MAIKLKKALVLYSLLALVLTTDGLKCINCYNCRNPSADIKVCKEGDICSKSISMKGEKEIVSRNCVREETKEPVRCESTETNYKVCMYFCKEDKCNGSPVSFTPPKLRVVIFAIVLLFLSNYDGWQ